MTKAVDVVECKSGGKPQATRLSIFDLSKNLKDNNHDEISKWEVDKKKKKL